MCQLHQKQREKAQNDKQKQFALKKKENAEADGKPICIEKEESDEKSEEDTP